MREASGIYEPMLPHGWIGPRPDDHRRGQIADAPVPRAWCEDVVNIALHCGIRVTAQRRGFVVYDFADWPPGVANRGRGMRTLREASAEATPALIQRLRVMNTHQILLHSAMLVTSNESPPVARVGRRDLYSWDHDESGSEYWASWTGVLCDTVTPADRVRTGTVPIATFERSLASLDHVMTAGSLSLIQFDLLSQVHAAVATHARASAVVAGWTVCELSLNQLNNCLQQPLPPDRGKTTPNVKRVMNRLEQDGDLDPGTKQRLRDVCDKRDTWLHAGLEPADDVALEALQLATLMLRRLVPDLSTRAVGQLVIL
jgi:hypothetical protein